MKQLAALLFSLAFTSNSFGMEKNSDQNIIDYTTVPFDVVAELQENNKLLHEIKKQNRFIKKQNHVIIKQNYLNHEYMRYHVEYCTNTTHLGSEILGNKKVAIDIREIYLAQCALNELEGSSSEEKK